MDPNFATGNPRLMEVNSEIFPSTSQSFSLCPDVGLLQFSGLELGF